MTMLRTPAAARNLPEGGERFDAYGFDAPLVVSDELDEYWAVRRAAGLIDFSMLLKVDVEGPGALEAVNSVVCRDISKATPGRILYGPVVDDAGMMIDDSTCMIFSPEHVRVIGGPGMPDAVSAGCAGRGVRWTDRRPEIAHLNLQGPNSRAIFAKVTTEDVSTGAFPYYTFRPSMEVAGIPCFVTRMGYTAELGYEFFPPVERALDLWDALMEAGAEDGLLPVGIKALLTLRTEAGMALGDVDYDLTISPWECNLGWAVELDKPTFRGQEALRGLKDTAPFRMVTVRFDGGGEALTDAALEHGGEAIGKVTMAVVSPVLGDATIGLARVRKEHARIGQAVTAVAEPRAVEGEIVRTPAYDPDRLRVRS